MIISILASSSIILGIMFCCISVLGILRIKDVYTRQHAAALVDSSGVFFICLGLILISGTSLVSFKTFLIGFVVIAIGAPVCYAFMQLLIRQKEYKYNNKK